MQYFTEVKFHGQAGNENTVNREFSETLSIFEKVARACSARRQQLIYRKRASTLDENMKNRYHMFTKLDVNK